MSENKAPVFLPLFLKAMTLEATAHAKLTVGVRPFEMNPLYDFA